MADHDKPEADKKAPTAAPFFQLPAPPEKNAPAPKTCCQEPAPTAENTSEDVMNNSEENPNPTATPEQETPAAAPPPDPAKKPKPRAYRPCPYAGTELCGCRKRCGRGSGLTGVIWAIGALVLLAVLGGFALAHFAQPKPVNPPVIVVPQAPQATPLPLPRPDHSPDTGGWSAPTTPPQTTPATPPVSHRVTEITIPTFPGHPQDTSTFDFRRRQVCFHTHNNPGFPDGKCVPYIFMAAKMKASYDCLCKENSTKPGQCPKAANKP